MSLIKINTKSIPDSAVTTAKIADDAVSSAKLFAKNLGRRNIIINGAMQVAQRSTSETGIFDASKYETLDRFKIIGSTSGRATMTQTADGPSGFANCLKLDCTTADTSIAAGEYGILRYLIEGQDVQQLKKGTSDAEKVTISFYVKGNASATYQLEFKDVDNNRINSQAFSVTTSWNRIELTFAADTTGAFDDDISGSIQLNFWLHAGSTYTTGTNVSNTWAASSDGNRVGSITSFFDSTDRTFFITGVQMEVGDTATDFEHRSFGEELALCQRYFQRIFRGSSAPQSTQTTAISGGVWYQANQVLATLFYTAKRTSPTITQSETGALGAYGNGYFRTSTDSTPFDSITEESCRLNINSFNSNGTAGEGAFVQLVTDNSSNISVDAEL